MAKSLEEARKELDDEYGQVRRYVDKIHKALDAVEKAGPEDDLDQVKEVRTGGLMGHGANGYKRAPNDYLEMKKGK